MMMLWRGKQWLAAQLRNHWHNHHNFQLPLSLISYMNAPVMAAGKLTFTNTTQLDLANLLADTNANANDQIFVWLDLSKPDLCKDLNSLTTAFGLEGWKWDLPVNCDLHLCVQPLSKGVTSVSEATPSCNVSNISDGVFSFDRKQKVTVYVVLTTHQRFLFSENK